MIDTPEPPPGRRSRLEDEALEILSRSDRPPTFSERVQSNARQKRRQFGHLSSRGGNLLSSPFDNGMWLVWCIGLAIVAFILRDMSPFAARILGFACIAIVLWAIVRSFSRPSRNNVKQWRGRDIDVSPMSRPMWLDRFTRNRKPPKPPYR